MSCPVTGEKSPSKAEESQVGCPVKHGGSSSGNSSWLGWIWGSSPDSTTNAEGEGTTYNSRANDMAFGQERQKGQKMALSTTRTVSSIKKSDFTPAHQPSAESEEGESKWVYPSEQQYFNAMKRKGWDPKEEDMPVVLAIHNVVNEQGWAKVMEWERLRGCDPSEVKLSKFMGRPKDVSPKARLLNMMGYELPFDRHDWIVERPNQENARYVLDFYKGKLHPQAKAPIGMFLDVRPALDSPTALLDRAYVFCSQTFLGENPLRTPRPAEPTVPSPASSASRDKTKK